VSSAVEMVVAAVFTTAGEGDEVVDLFGESPVMGGLAGVTFDDGFAVFFVALAEEAIVSAKTFAICAATIVQSWCKDAVFAA
jgi:hypothetical protein